VNPPPIQFPKPAELRVLYLLRDRVPAFRWDPHRVVLCVRDYRAHVDVEEVAARCADWMISGQATRVRDPDGTLRSFMAREKQSVLERPEMPMLARYDRQAGRSDESSARYGSAASSP
jgi:hypothetical protein